MKNFTALFFLTLLFAAQSCIGPEGPQGPPGPRGADGLDGLNGEEAYVFEYTFDFEAPEYSVLLEFTNDFVALDSDVVLVYLLWDVDGDVEIWRMLPQNSMTDFGFLSYNYDFSKYDARLFLEANFNLNHLGSPYLSNWLARVVVVPGQFAGRVDYNDYHAVKELFNLPDRQIPADYEISARPN